MRTVVAFLLIAVGVLALGVSLTSEQWSVAFDQYQQNAAFQAMVPNLVIGTGLLSLASVATGVFILWRGGGPMERWKAYLPSLSRLAAENGQTVGLDRRSGLEFLAFRDGQRIYVRAHQDPEPSLVIHGTIAGRQSLTFVRTEDAQKPTANRSTVVGGGRGWQLRAELPAIARTLLNDVVMVSMMDRFFAHTETVGIVHDGSGIEVVSALPTPDQVERRARQALDIVSYLRRVNG